MAKRSDGTDADKPSGGAKGNTSGRAGMLDPGTVKGAGGDISGRHPPEYGEIERETTYEEREDDAELD